MQLSKSPGSTPTHSTTYGENSLADGLLKSPSRSDSLSRQRVLSSVINSPKLIDDACQSPVAPMQPISALSFRQYINYQASLQQSQANVTPVSIGMLNHMPCAAGVGGNAYNPQFSNEHIMNIIKHKSLQKLKKIEAQVRRIVIWENYYKSL